MKINRFAIIYLVIVSIAFVSVREVLHSHYFASLVSTKITEWVSNKLDGKVKIGKIKIEIFPFGMNLQEVQFESRDIKVDIAAVSVVYGLQNIFKSDVFVEEVTLREGVVEVNRIESNDKDKSLDAVLNEFKKEWPKLYTKIEELPVKVENLIVQNVNLTYDNNTLSLPFSHLKLDDDINLKLLIEKIAIKDLIKEKVLLPESIAINISINDLALTINELVLQKGMAKLSGEGKIDISNDFLLQNVNVTVKGPDQAFFDILPESAEFDTSFSAYSQSHFFLTGNVFKPQIKAFLNLEEIDGKFLKAKSLSAVIDYNDDIITIENVRVSDEFGTIDISSNTKFTFNEVENGKAIDLKIKLNDIYTKTIFHFLNGKLDPFDAYLNGEISATVTKNKLLLKGAEKLSLGVFNLMLSPPEPLLSINNPLLSNLSINLDFEPFKLKLSTQLSLPNSEIGIDAKIDDKGISAKLIGSSFNFSDIPEISNVPLSGAGELNIDVNGPWSNIIFDLNGKFQNSIVAGYNLGNLDFIAELPLQEKRLTFKSINAKKGSTLLDAKVNLALSPKAYPLLIEYSASRATYNDLIDILHPIIPDELKNYKDIQARFKTKGKVQIDFNNRPVKLDLNVDGSSLSYQGEYFDGFGAEVLMNAGRLNIRNLQLSREESKGTGVLILDTDTNYLEYEFLMKKISLRSFSLYRLTPLALDGNLTFDIYGSGILDNDHSLRATVTLDDSKIKRTIVPNSRLDAYYSKGEWTFQAELMEGMARAEAFLPNIKSFKKNALIRLDVSSADIKPLIGLLSPDRMNDESLSGRMFSQVQASFPINKPEHADIKLDIRDVQLKYKNKRFRLAKSNIQSVKKGIFKDWIFASTESSDLRVMSKASGDLGGNFNFNSSYTIPAEFFELASDKLIDMSGELSGSTNIDWDESGFKAYISHKASDLQMRIRDLPGKISDLIFEAAFEDDNFRISKFTGKYGRGEFSILGDIKAKFPYPNINLKLSSSNVTVPFFNKSEATFDSRFNLLGSKPPYLLTGSVLLHKVLLLEDVGTYLGKVSSSSNYEKFIPNTTQSFLNQFIELDATVIANNSIRVSNPLMNLNLGANLKMTGPITSPEILGKVYGVPTQSKIAFKGHEFVLSKSTVEFDSDSGSTKASIDLNGKTLVSGYNIDLNVNGAIDQMNILLSSEPPLPQDEIVSLLTLGITSDVSKNLNEQDRRSITTMSLGGFLFDQLQLTKGLDDNLGLKVSLAPEFSGDEGNLIEEASSDTSTARRLKTGTKLRVQSQLGKKTSVSFSSTLGGEVEQKQEMNVNYDFNRAWSLEGVYELKSSTEENQIETQSIGADVKYKWSF
ncbi:MAG: hypothetical protein COV38_13730 [Bdellovibrionales bacterium CG11_big_fil_rev_8_21_14_0_20_38_13]|nr:MAG: hypothetical protein COW79_05400 [Bdellovibrionales bacterium CG22_combo_CG10-13_8_21_14_all_38_13]PIR28907.1 MAG: hypothetical protein COV38_13730 [Bdellovibrionales bacterium CG11_big_fil_rev_8_21_14_0_20_38_13]